MRAQRRLLALLCSAALVRGAWPRLGAPIVSLTSAPSPPQPLLPPWQCNAQDGSIARDGVTVDASLPCNWGLSAEAAPTPSASCSGAELLAAIGEKEFDDLPKCAKELTLKQGALRAKELADFGAFFRAPPAVPCFAHGAQLAAARAALRSTTKATCQWMLELIEAGHLEATCYLEPIWRSVLHGVAEADEAAAVVGRDEMPLELAEARLVHRAFATSEGPPSSESRSFARGGGCPLQWLPMFYTVVGTPSPPPPSTGPPPAQPPTSSQDPQSPSPPSPYIRASPAPSPVAAIGTEVEGMRALSEFLCIDTDGVATDRYGDGCSAYTSYPEDCGGYDDTAFTSITMCCACGGGIMPPSLPPSPPPPPSPPLPPPQLPSPPSPPPSPPSPPLHPGSRYAVSSSDLIAALGDSAVSRIVLKPGTYELADDMCSTLGGGSALCIDRPVTIKAEVAGSVVLDAQRARRVIYVAAAGRAELVGLNITGGTANDGGGINIDYGGMATLIDMNVYENHADYGGGLYIEDSGTATLTDTNMYENRAVYGGGLSINIGGTAALTDTNVYENRAGEIGGGLHIGGTATLTDTNVYENRAKYGGGLAIYGTAALTDTNVHKNRAGAYGGGLYNHGTATLTDTNVHENRAGKEIGCNIDSAGTLTLQNISVASSQSSCPSSSMLVLAEATTIHCPLGWWVPPSPLTLPAMNFTGCPYQCAAGHFGNTSHETDYTCSGACNDGGEYCPAATVQPLPCPAGTYLPVGVAGLLEASCIPCAPGAYNPDEGGARCLTCPAGKLSGSVRSTECSDCPSGGFCSAEGAASLRQTFTPCPAGAFNPDGGQTSNTSCQACAPGKANPIPGSSDPADCRDCSAGFVAAASGAAFCDRCAAGKYQANEGNQACVACEPGSYCPEGASAPLPCKEGTYSNETDLGSAEDCTPTTPGFHAPTGSTEQTECSPGTFQSVAGKAECDKCVAGKYQPFSGGSECIVCGVGNYSSNVLSCEPCQVGEYCPAGSVVGTPCSLRYTTEGRGAEKLDDCGCPAGTFDNGTSCKPCVADLMNCTRTGLTLATNRTTDIKPCDTFNGTSPCLGGVDGTTCAVGHEGPRCEWCSDPDRYYDAVSATCKECGNVERYALKQLAVLLAIIVFLALLRLASLRMPRLLARVSGRLAQFATSVQHLGLQAKFKLLLSFAQVWMVRESVYGFTLPSQFSDWLSVLTPLSFDFGSFIFPDWKCIGGLTTRLAFNGLWPLVLTLTVALALAARKGVRQGSLKAVALHSLEAAVFISFCALPSVTRSLFLAFQCETFGFDDATSFDDPTSETKSYLTASLDIECTGPAHQPIIALAAVFIALWPLAMPLLYAILLYCCRGPIQHHQPSPLSRAIRFLWSDYEDGYYWYEMVLLTKKLVLTNFVLFINFGGDDQLLRLLVGLLIAFFSLTLQQQTQPFRKRSDDALSSVVELMLVLFFILGIVLKLCDTAEACSSVVGLDSAYTASVLMICMALIGVLVPIEMVVHRLFFARRVPILRDAHTMEPPELLLGEDERYHLFLSHIWSTGQDQCAVIKRQLQLLLPGIIVFLDVDDLQDIGDLEGYVRATSVMLFFLSKKYFGSRNCLKEVRATLEEKKPLVLVQEQQEDKGGGPLELLKAECRDEQMREAIFDGRTPIVWHRISHFQNLSLKLIATEMLRSEPSYQMSLNLGDDAPEDLVLIQDGELDAAKLALPRPLVLWCSAGNPGAAEVAKELVTSMASNGAAIRVVDTMPDVKALKRNGESAAMLLYLNKATWIQQCEVLDRDVRAARKLRTGLKVVLVHENDKEKGGCEFGDFFGTTPQELIDDGIYSDIAVALHTPPHRAVSLALVAQALGATQGKGRLSAELSLSMKNLSNSSFVLPKV